MSMLQKYLHFSKKRVACFIFISIAIFVLQFVLTGSMLAKQQVTTEAGNSQSSVIGILDDTEIIRQKFQFDRKVVLSGFTLSFGSFEYDKVGTDLHIQMLDGENNHHIIEAAFKAFAKALDQATQYDDRIQEVLSTKGSL